MELEKKFNFKFPSDIVEILSECGFDTESSLSYINQDIINDIEEHVNSMLSILKNTTYDGVNHFKLKPGHKSFLLNLPNLLKDFNCVQKPQCNTSDLFSLTYSSIDFIELKSIKDIAASQSNPASIIILSKPCNNFLPTINFNLL